MTDESDKLIPFSCLSEGEKFKNPKTRSVYIKKNDIVSNAVSLTNVRVRFKPSELVVRVNNV